MAVNKPREKLLLLRWQLLDDVLSRWLLQGWICLFLSHHLVHWAERDFDLFPSDGRKALWQQRSLLRWSRLSFLEEDLWRFAAVRQRARKGELHNNLHCRVSVYTLYALVGKQLFDHVSDDFRQWYDEYRTRQSRFEDLVDYRFRVQ